MTRRAALGLLLACLARIGTLPARAGTAEAAGQGDTIVVALPGPRAFPYLPLELIGSLGHDRRAGFQLRLRYFGGGPLALKDMLDGNSHFAVLGMPAMAGVALSQRDLRSIAVVTRSPAYTLLIRSDLRREVRALRDLRGRRIGVHTGSKSGKTTARQVAEYLVRQAGIPFDEVDFAPVGQKYDDYAAALRSGAVDAIVTNEPAVTLLADAGIAWRLVDLHDPAQAREHLGETFLYTQLCARASLLDAEPGKAARLARALRETLSWIQSTSPEALARHLEPRDTARQAQLARTLQRVRPAYSRDGRFDTRSLRATERFFRAVSEDLPGAASLDFTTLVDSRWIAP